MNIRLMKLLDAAVGSIAVSVFPVPPCVQLPAEVTSLLLIRPGGIGDAVLLAPAICSLKKSFPALQITVLAEQRNAAVFTMIPDVVEVLCYDRPGELLRALRSGYDCVIDSEQSHCLSAVVARFTQAPLKIGFATNERRRMFTHTLPYSHDQYEALSFANLLQPLGRDGADVAMVAPFLSVLPAASSRAAALLGVLHEQPFVAIFPGASIAERRWGAERFRRVAELVSEAGINVVVVGGKADRQQGELIAADGVGLNLAGVTTLAETAAVIKKSALLLSGDSGVLHIAVGLGVPTVSLFGPGRACKWAPQGDRHSVINKGLPCSPCTTFGSTPACPNNVRCMQEISVDDVVRAMDALITCSSVISLQNKKLT